MDKEHQIRQNLIEYVNIALSCLLAFAGSYFILPRSGIFSTLMLIIPFAFACAVLKLKWWVKFVSFAGFGYIMSTIYSDSVTQSVITGIICGVLVMLAMLSIWFFKKRKLVYTVAAVAIIAVTAAFHFTVMGNPFEAFRSENMIKEYVSDNYDTNYVILSGTYYDRSMKTFRADIYGKNDPTAVYSIYVFGNTLMENYNKYVEYTLMADKRLEITETLRGKYPDASFYVNQQSISGFPEGIMSPYDTADYSKRMCFGIYIPSDITMSEFKARIKAYTITLCDEDTGVKELFFYGGIADSYFRIIPAYLSAIPQTYRRYAVTHNLTEEYICRSVYPNFPE